MIRIIVEFDLWGQRCQTVFDDSSELAPLKWLQTCTEKGFLKPIQVFNENGLVVYTESELEALSDKWMG